MPFRNQSAGIFFTLFFLLDDRMRFSTATRREAKRQVLESQDPAGSRINMVRSPALLSGGG